MKNLNSHAPADVVLLYQDRETVEPSIQQIMQLDLNFKTYKFDPEKLHEIIEIKPRIVLLSSNNVKNTIRFYIDYLEEYENNISPHSAILLINNREVSHAYLACENGLFDNYVIINPMNEPFRLSFTLLQELKIINRHKNNSLHKLISDGEDELASCIEHGVTLKNTFIQETEKCGEGILSAANSLKVDEETKSVIQNIVDVSLKKLNSNVTSNIESVLNQLVELKVNNHSIKKNVEAHSKPKVKTTIGLNTDTLTSHIIDNKNTIIKAVTKYL